MNRLGLIKILSLYFPCCVARHSRRQVVRPNHPAKISYCNQPDKPWISWSSPAPSQVAQGWRFMRQPPPQPHPTLPVEGMAEVEGLKSLMHGLFKVQLPFQESDLVIWKSLLLEFYQQENRQQVIRQHLLKWMKNCVKCFDAKSNVNVPSGLPFFTLERSDKHISVVKTMTQGM